MKIEFFFFWTYRHADEKQSKWTNDFENHWLELDIDEKQHLRLLQWKLNSVNEGNASTNLCANASFRLLHFSVPPSLLNWNFYSFCLFFPVFLSRTHTDRELLSLCLCMYLCRVHFHMWIYQLELHRWQRLLLAHADIFTVVIVSIGSTLGTYTYSYIRAYTLVRKSKPYFFWSDGMFQLRDEDPATTLHDTRTSCRALSFVEFQNEKMKTEGNGRPFTKDTKQKRKWEAKIKTE